MEITINMMDLVDLTGNMYNAVDVLTSIQKDTNIGYKLLGERNWSKTDTMNKIKHYKIHHGENNPNDDEAISLPYSPPCNYSYGYLRKLSRDKIIFKFDYNSDESNLFEIMKDLFDKRLQKEKELKHKYKDIDPYGEEDWLEESYIKKYEDFL